MTGRATPTPVLHGPSYAGYVKVVRLVFEEKGVPHELAHFDFPARPAGFERLNPFGTVPVVEHGDLVLYEAIAIARYVDEAFDGPQLQPAKAQARARMAQVVAIMDQVGAPTMLRTVYTERFKQLVLNVPHDEPAIATALDRARVCLAEFERMMGGHPYLAGDAISLADLFVVPNLLYFLDTVEGAEVMRGFPALALWLERMGQRESVRRAGLPELPAPKTAGQPA